MLGAERQVDELGRGRGTVLGVERHGPADGRVGSHGLVVVGIGRAPVVATLTGPPSVTLALETRCSACGRRRCVFVDLQQMDVKPF